MSEKNEITEELPDEDFIERLNRIINETLIDIKQKIFGEGKSQEAIVYQKIMENGGDPIAIDRLRCETNDISVIINRIEKKIREYNRRYKPLIEPFIQKEEDRDDKRKKYVSFGHNISRKLLKKRKNP